VFNEGPRPTWGAEINEPSQTKIISSAPHKALAAALGNRPEDCRRPKSSELRDAPDRLRVFFCYGRNVKNNARPTETKRRAH